jgi:lupus La protein
LILDREASSGGGTEGKKAEKPKPEVYLQFMGAKLRVREDEEGLGYVNEEDVIHVKGATLKFEGWEGEVAYKDVKVKGIFSNMAV